METKTKPTQEEINSALWAACDTFRSSMDSQSYKDYILAFLFFKYLSDKYRDKYNEFKEQFGDDEALIQRRLAREPFILGEDCTFEYVVENNSQPSILPLSSRVDITVFITLVSLPVLPRPVKFDIGLISPSK